MNIHIILIAYAVDVTPLVVGLYGDDTTFHIFQHGFDNEIIRLCDVLVQNYEHVYHYSYQTNRGLARSWNEGLLIAQAMDADVMVLLNDDMLVSRDDLMLLSHAAYEHREHGIIEVRGYDSNMQRDQSLNFGFCAINPIALNTVGYFDENLFPIYFEDSDYSRRCGLTGVTFYDAGPSTAKHLGSQAIRRVPELNEQNKITFAASAAYYRRKWGGLPGSETCPYPFYDVTTCFIGAAERHTPYMEHDRTDQEIVRL